MKNFYFVAIGAALGGTSRYWISGLVQRLLPSGFPAGTLVVNILASFILGFLIFFFESRSLLSPGVRLLLTTGFCGGFSTFSTFSYETVTLLRDSEYLYAGLNIGLNIVLTLGAVILAYILSKALIGG